MSWHEDKIAYLEMIQGVVNRMASTSSTFKGIAMTLFAGVLAIVFSLDGPNRGLALIFATLSLIGIAGFDCWYLMLEKRYRRLYEEVLVGKHAMDFNLTNDRRLKVKPSEVLGSKSIWLFYSLIVGTNCVLIAMCTCGVI